MRGYFVVFTCLLLVPICFAYDERVSVLLHENGSAEEHYTLTITSAVSDTSFTFPLDGPVKTVLYPGNFTQTDTALMFEYPIKPGVNKPEFTIIRENASVGATNLRRYGGTFSTPKNTALTVSVTLPEGMVVRDIDPAVSPRPTAIRSDGRSVVIEWVQTGSLDAMVLYEIPGPVVTNLTAPQNNTEKLLDGSVSERRLFSIAAATLVLIVAIVLILAGLARRKSRRKRKETLMDVLSPDEQQVVEFLRHGYTNQKQIASQAGFSKSKMSKVVRKLEEKHAITKQPHFKTNKLALLPDWK